MIDPLYFPRYGGRSWMYPWQREMRNRASLRIITQASVEPMTLDEAAQHLRLDAYGSPATYVDADLVQALISASREYIEFITGLVLAPQVVEVSMRAFVHECCWIPDQGIPLKTAPINGILSVTYVGDDGNDVVLDPAGFILDNASEVPILYPAYGTSWPYARDQPNSLRIRMSAGYDNQAMGSPTTDNLIPYSLVAAMKLTIGTLYENREDTNVGNIVTRLPLGIQALCERYRIRMPIA